MDTNPKPIISPVAALLKSRKTIVALVTAIVNVLVLAAPSLEPVRGELVTILTILGTVLIASISHEDAAAKSSPTTINAPTLGDVKVTPPADVPPAG
jgi:hypothetical protein